MLQIFNYKHQIWKLFLKLTGILWCIFLSKVPILGQTEPNVQLSWLEGDPPALSAGVSWGVPFPEGQVKKESYFLLTNTQGDSMTVQSWPLAYWPDGSLKWAGLSTVIDSKADSTYQLKTAKVPFNKHLGPQVSLNEIGQVVQINTGILQCEIPRQGNKIISSLKINNQEISSGGELVCILQNGPETEYGQQPAKEKYVGEIEKVTVEQNGSVRAVIKIEGKHVAESGNRCWLPFIVRLYFYAGQQSVKLVHTIIYDGDQEKDFIRGLGIVFNVPLDEELYNRHIRFSGGDIGLWNEPVKPLTGRMPLSREKDWYLLQLETERIPQKAFSREQQFLINHWASWNDFKLFQGNADGFRIQKRTNDQSAWIDAGAGHRSSGLAFVGDISGGLAVSIRNFWQSFPSALEIRNAKSNKAELKAWLWSPDGPTMEMRHYDTLAWGHNLEASYEDVQPEFSTATGVGRTSEVLLFASQEVPSLKMLNQLSQQANQPPLLTTSPEYLHSIPVFGIWSLPDRSTKGKQWIENQLDNAFKYYKLEVEQRHWYGFWDYGDVMHAYDPERHVWRYDIGGYAWDNTELMPNMWLWYTYLRSGREDVFRMAEAMTRHTGEVDVYHLGRFKGLGSRHNVRHWGCGAKEVRISQAALSRFYYYLTTDERTGDLMHVSAEASNKAIGEIDPVRLIMKKSEYPTHIRVGPDWLALVGNWMTEWERTGDTKYRDKILAGVNSLYKMPYGFFSGYNAAFGYDPATNELYQLNKNDIGYLHLSVLMGGPEVAFELTGLLHNKKWDKLWLQFCKLYGAPVDSIKKEFGKRVKLGDPGIWNARLPAYYSMVKHEPGWGIRAWNEFLGSGHGWYYPSFKMKFFRDYESLNPVFEIRNASTNTTAQWCLNAIELLELVGNQIPEDNPRFQEIVSVDQYKKGELLYKDNFNQGLENWIKEIESSSNSTIKTNNEKIIINVGGGVTVWLNKKLSGNILIEYKRKVIMDNGPNDRLSDLNQFWMAQDPRRDNLFTRKGTFAEYDSLRLYYAGIGGNSNTTTRFRKYLGNGERMLVRDLTDTEHLLKPNKTYLIQIVVYNGTTKVFVDKKEYFSFYDDNPLKEGYFGFRTVKSHQEVEDFKIYRLIE